MSPKARIIAAALGAMALALGMGWFGFRSARIAKISLAEVYRKRAAVDERARRMKEQIAAYARDRMELQVAPPPAAAPGAAAENPDASDLAVLLASNPGLFALGMKVYRANLTPHFAPLYRALGLSPAQIGKFEDLMAGNQEAMIDLKAASLSQGLENSDEAVSTVRMEQDEQLRAAQIALLGGDGYEQLLQFNRVQPVEEIVTNVATTVALTSAPLSGEQAGQLTRFLANASSSYQSGEQADPATINWDAALSQARGILSSAQFEALKAEYLKPQLDRMHTQFNQQEFEKK